LHSRNWDTKRLRYEHPHFTNDEKALTGHHFLVTLENDGNGYGIELESSF
jgi:hypothetical protein